MSVADGRRKYAERRQSGRLTTDTLMQRTQLRYRAKRGDEEAGKTLAAWEAKHPDQAKTEAERFRGIRPGGGDAA